jgi:hypothetical protein
VDLCEIGNCYEGTALRLRVYAARNRLGVWTVVVSEPGGHRIRTTYPDEAAARRNIELAYRFGRESGGWWLIERRSGYRPDPAAGPFSPTGTSPDRLTGASEV